MGARILLVVLMVLLLLGVAHAPAATDQKGTLVIALDTLGAQTMDPILETRAPHAHYQAPVFDSIIWFDPVKGGIGPGVAERWELAADGQRRKWPPTIKCPVISMHKRGSCSAVRR